MDQSEKKTESVCNLKYLTEMMGFKKHLIKGIMDAFLTQIPEELSVLNSAIAKEDFVTIKNLAHTMKSSVSIMGMTTLTPILKEMEILGANAGDIEKIRFLNGQLNAICKEALEEIDAEKHHYI